MKVVLIGRHRLMPLQKKAVKDLGMEIVRIVEKLPEDPQQLRAFLADLKREANAVLTVALPVNLLNEIKNSGLGLYMFKMDSTTANSEDEAKRWVEQKPDRRAYLPGSPIRLIEFKEIAEFQGLDVEEEIVWSSNIHRSDWKGLKAAFVGRHRLLPLQEEALKELGVEILEKIENLPSDISQLRTFVKELKQKVNAIVTVALPPHMLAEIRNAGFEVFRLGMNSSIASTEDEAKKWVAEAPDRRTYLLGRPGEPVRLLEFSNVSRIKRIAIKERTVWTSNETARSRDVELAKA